MSRLNTDSVLLHGYVTEKQFAQQIGVSPRTVWRWRNEPNGLPYITLGRAILINVAAARAWIDSK